jgi:cytoskeleton protein RodZ
LPLLIAVAVGLVVFVIRRVFFRRRLTIEQSVDRYRRTLSAVHEAASRSRATDGTPTGPTPFTPQRTSSRSARLGSRRMLAVAAMVVATVVTIGIVIAQNRGDDNQRSSRTTAPTTTTTPATTTTRLAPTTTVALVTAGGASGTDFTVAKATYNLVVQSTTGDCWIDARDPSGSSLFSGVVVNGQSQSISAASAVTLRLGNPAAVKLSIEGTPVPFPVANGSPVTLHFIPA